MINAAVMKEIGICPDCDLGIECHLVLAGVAFCAPPEERERVLRESKVIEDKPDE